MTTSRFSFCNGSLHSGVDAYRNVLETAVATFTTTVAGGVPYPDIVAVGWTGVVQPETTMTVALTWYPVPSPT